MPTPDFKTLFESLPGLYLILNTKLKIVAVSDAYLNATMTRREDIVGHNIFEIFPDNPNDPATKGVSALGASFDRVLKTKIPDAMPVQKYDIRKPVSEGGGFEVRYWNPINSPLLDGKGNITHLIHCVEDVTRIVLLKQQNSEHMKENEALRAQIIERQEAERISDKLRQAQKMEALGQLTGGIAHDFNNLLAVILGNLDFIQERIKDDERLEKFIRPCIEASEHGAELTSQLLAFGRKQALMPEIISPNDLIQNFLPMVKHTLGEQLKLIVHCESGIWNIHADPGQLQNALLNLCLNARDAMPQGGSIILETRNMQFGDEYASNNMDVSPGEYVLISVSDTGIGMTEEIRERAFEPFFTTKDMGRGTGLGLSMVYGFVKQSQGHIKIYSERDRGTTVKIYLPRSLENAVRKATLQTHAPHHHMGGKDKTILIVEDNKNVLALTSTIVESLGYNILQADSGYAAIVILTSRKDIDLLLTDVMLPGKLNGPELAKRALELYPNIKVLFNSGYAEQAIFETGILEKGMPLISKPFRKHELAEKIAELLT